ncbi:fasciclin-2 isoform X2 [Hyalella azteca]|uniref:Fasciclin-2 isoform X2 n=1 Tax=Hyalella azteca TaxID=294128 RepID=A0A979FPQ4_HYAAZ|nr:fasciclin-2 isoform X2 [Hyalella azteca]
MRTRNVQQLMLLVFLQLFQVILAQEPRLLIQPDGQISKSLGETVYVSCRAEVSDPNLVTEMRWTGPGSNEIPNYDRTIEIIEDGPGSLGLYIQKLREEDTGTYNCSAVYAGNQNLMSSIQVMSFVKIDFGDTPSHQTPIVGTDALIKCLVTSSPSPVIDWLKDGRPLRTDERHIIQQDGVLVRGITEGDEGVYRCRARVALLGALDSRDIQVEVYVPPKITTRPQDTSGVEKEAVTFQCVAEGKPAPKYSWVDDQSRPLGGQEGYYVDEVKGELTVLDLRPDQAGTYRCTATNPAGNDVAEAQLRVLTKPKLEQFLNITVPVAGNAEFRCVFSGDPRPNISFQKETSVEPFYDGINSDARIEVEQTVDDYGNSVGIMKISDVKRSDDGLYTCTGSSGGGETIGWGHITVQFAPTFEKQPTDEFWSWEQEKVNLTCVASSIPNATIQWYIRNEEIPQRDPNLRVLALGPTGVLEVNPLDNSYFGTYTCQATNELGVVNHDVTLKQVHKPGPVTSVKVDKITATTITWRILEPHDNGGRPITSFLVQYKLRNMAWDDAEASSWTKGSAYTLERLLPKEHYVFRFAAKNEVGISEWSGEKSEQMPEVTVPEEPLIFVNDEGVNFVPYTDHYDLQWKTPLDNGDPINYFTVIYYQVVEDGSGGWKTLGAKIEKTVEFPGVTTYQIQKLRPDTHYRIELRAHNSIGYSSPAELVIKTAHGSPAGAPYTEPTLGIGIVVGIVIIGALVLLIILDLVCFFCRDAGVTASLVKAVASKEKDKEAMIDNVKNNSNGFSKGSDSSPLDSQEKDKEPSETTPMIHGRIETLPEVITINNNQHKRSADARPGLSISLQRLNDVRGTWSKNRNNFPNEFVYQNCKKSPDYQQNLSPVTPTKEMLAWNREARPISMTAMRTSQSTEFFKSLNDITEDGDHPHQCGNSMGLQNRRVQSQGNLLDDQSNVERKSILSRPTGPPPRVPQAPKKAPPPLPSRSSKTQLSTKNLAAVSYEKGLDYSSDFKSNFLPEGHTRSNRSNAHIYVAVPPNDVRNRFYNTTSSHLVAAGNYPNGYTSDASSSSMYAGSGIIPQPPRVAHQIAPYQKFQDAANSHKILEEVRSTDSDMYQIVDFAPNLLVEAAKLDSQSPQRSSFKPTNLNDFPTQHFVPAPSSHLSSYKPTTKSMYDLNRLNYTVAMPQPPNSLPMEVPRLGTRPANRHISPAFSMLELNLNRIPKGYGQGSSQKPSAL